MNQQQTPLVSRTTDEKQYEHIQKKQIPEMQRKKGTQFLLTNQFQKANNAYSKAIIVFQELIKNKTISPQQIKVMLKQTILPCYSNLTLCFFKLEKYQQVIKFASRVLDVDKNNVKAYYRRGVSQKKLGKYRESKQDLNRVKLLDESMKSEIDKLLKQIYNLQKKEKEKQKKIAEALINNYSSDINMTESDNNVQNIGFVKRSIQKLKQYCQKLAQLLRLKKS